MGEDGARLRQLVGLQVEQYEVRLTLHGEIRDRRQQGGLENKECPNDEGTEPKSHQHDHCLVLRAVEIGNTLANRVGSRAARQLPSQATQHDGNRSENAHCGCEARDQAEGEQRLIGMPPGRQPEHQGEGHAEAQHPRIGGCRPRRRRKHPQRLQRSHTAERQQWEGGEQHGDDYPGGDPLGDGTPRDREVDGDRQECVHGEGQHAGLRRRARPRDSHRPRTSTGACRRYAHRQPPRCAQVQQGRNGPNLVACVQPHGAAHLDTS